MRARPQPPVPWDGSIGSPGALEVWRRVTVEPRDLDRSHLPAAMVDRIAAIRLRRLIDTGESRDTAALVEDWEPILGGVA